MEPSRLSHPGPPARARSFISIAFQPAAPGKQAGPGRRGCRLRKQFRSGRRTQLDVTPKAWRDSSAALDGSWLFPSLAALSRPLCWQTPPSPPDCRVVLGFVSALWLLQQSPLQQIPARPVDLSIFYTGRAPTFSFPVITSSGGSRLLHATVYLTSSLRCPKDNSTFPTSLLFLQLPSIFSPKFWKKPTLGVILTIVCPCTWHPRHQ